MFEAIRESFDSKPKFDFRIDARNSFITTRAARIAGIKIGLEYNDAVRIGLGYNWLTSDLKRTVQVPLPDFGAYDTTAYLKFGYFSPYFEYTFFHSRKWQINIPVQIGIGSYHYEYINRRRETGRLQKQAVLLYEPAMTGHYKVIPWIGVGFGVGYRILFIGNSGIRENFNSPIYVFKLKIFLGEIYRSITGQGRIKKQ